jgi:hypothetical protein
MAAALPAIRRKLSISCSLVTGTPLPFASSLGVAFEAFRHN